MGMKGEQKLRVGWESANKKSSANTHAKSYDLTSVCMRKKVSYMPCRQKIGDTGMSPIKPNLKQTKVT